MKGIPFIDIDITKDKDATSYIASLGYRTLPVVVSDHGHWSGHNPAKLSNLTSSK